MDGWTVGFGSSAYRFTASFGQLLRPEPSPEPKHRKAEERFVTYAPRYLDRIGACASILRSRRKGQLRRVSSMSFGSHLALSTASSVFGASARRRPNGSAMKE